MKATEGDFTINNQVDKYNNQQIAGGFSTEELLKSFQTDTKDTEIIKKDPSTRRIPGAFYFHFFLVTRTALPPTALGRLA